MKLPRIVTSSKAQAGALSAAMMVLLVKWARLDPEVAAALVALVTVVYQMATAYEDKVKVLR